MQPSRRLHRASRRLAPLLALAALGAACAAAPPSDRATAPPPPAAPAPASVEQGVIAGVVRGPDARPVQGALVAVIPAGGLGIEVAAQVRTGADGGFRAVGVPAGRYGITVTTPGLTGAYLDVFELPEGGAVTGREIQLGGEGITAQGTALDAKGKAVPGAMVYASRESNFEADLFVIPVGEDGRFRAALPRAGYHIEARAPGHVASPAQLEGDALALVLEREMPADQPAPDEVASWIKAHAIPLASVEAGRGFADMARIKDVVGQARVVSLGEATHGTREFFQLKHRMLELLVTEMGFTVFGIEASFPDTIAVNEYVLTGKGDPAAAVGGMGFWTWDTEEVLAMVTWMRRYNEDPAHRQKLRFHGFDMQSPPGSVRALVEYFRKVDRAFAPEVERALRPLDNGFDVGQYRQRPAAMIQATRAGIARVLERLEKERAGYERRSSPVAWATARLHANVIRQGERMHAQEAGSDQVRDHGMAENVRALLELEGPGAKMVLWAHNGHVSRSGYLGIESMGKALDRALGADQVIFGFAFHEGSFQALEIPLSTGRGLREFTVGPLGPGSLDATLARAGMPILALDLRAAPEGSPAASWLSSRLDSRVIGGAFREQGAFVAKDAPRASYDALLFVERTSAARPIGGRKPHKGGPPPAPAPALTNPGFEEVSAEGTPAGWQTLAPSMRGALELTAPEGGARAGKRSLVVRRKGPSHGGYGALTQRLDAAPYRGKRVRLTAAARAEALGPGAGARIALWASGPHGQPLGMADLFERPITASAWGDASVELTVPAEASTLQIGLVLIGDGRAGFDDVRLEVAGDAPKGP